MISMPKQPLVFITPWMRQRNLEPTYSLFGLISLRWSSWNGGTICTTFVADLHRVEAVEGEGEFELEFDFLFLTNEIGQLCEEKWGDAAGNGETDVGCC